MSNPDVENTSLAVPAPAGHDQTHATIHDRVRSSWAISLATLRANTTHCRDATQLAIVDAFLFCTKQNITRAEFALQVAAIGKKVCGPKFDFTDNYVYKFINGTYRLTKESPRLDMSETHLRGLQAWLKDQRAGRAAAIKSTDFIIMPTTRRIFSAVDLARESKKPVFLYGPSQIGKTCALQYKSETENHGRTPYIRLSAAAGVKGMLQAASRALGQSPASSKEKLREGLLAAFDENMVPLWDEFHLLAHTFRRESFFACAEVLRELYDRVKMGMVFSTTNLGRDELEANKLKELEQIFRRAPHRIQLPDGPTAEDVRCMVEHYQLEMPSRKMQVKVKGKLETPYALLAQLSLEQGFTAIVERLRYGRKMAEKEGREITWEDVAHAHLIMQDNAAAPEMGWHE